MFKKYKIKFIQSITESCIIIESYNKFKQKIENTFLQKAL